MSRIFTVLAITALLAGCDSKNPFMPDVVVEPVTGVTETLEPGDPNVDVNNKFAFDRTRNITMNSVEYDTANDRLIINNLPFDGPDGVYDDIAGERTTNARGQVTDIFQNREVVINGEMQYYAVLVKSDYLEATSAAGRNWGDFGFAGANVNRESFALPPAAQTSYEYLGVYAATRTYDERGGIELIRGDVRLLLDVTDLDPLEGFQGTVVGTVTGRTRDGTGDTMVGALPNIALESVRFDTATGVWESDGVSTYDNNGDVRDTGTHSGLIAGPNGEEMGGYLIMEGVADIQTVTFDIVQWSVTNLVTGVTTTGETPADQFADRDAIQALVNAGIPVANLTLDPINLPAGATVTGTRSDSFDISTEYDAREIGVFVADLN